MKITACMICVTEEYRASEALVLPVEAQAARLAPTNRAWLKAADMPLSLKLPEGFMPFVLQVQPVGLQADVAAHGGRHVQQRLPLAHGDALLDGHEGQQFVEPPHAAEADADRRGAPICPSKTCPATAAAATR